jgi:uncharacterized protein GlcG (DUF336 family)
LNYKFITLCVVLAACPAQAQGPAQKLPPEKSIPLDLALEAVQTAQAACMAKNSPATVEVADLNDNIKVLLSADGANPNSFEFARRKAYTVLKKGLSSGDFGKSLGMLPRNAPPIEGDPSLIQYAGALPIMRGTTLIGTISVSGPTGQVDDEICAHAGLDKIKDRL